ncbi:MAG: outer membrane protein assembly factor BamB [Candidatus Omnitrophota bacterium]|jgi:outer membrane protein assembly factor BamB
MNRFLLIPLFCATLAQAGDWNQWLGPDRNSQAVDSPRLIEQLPAGGMPPIWKSDSFKSGFDGGWSSPVVANGTAFLFSHHRSLKDGAQLPKREYPWLPDDKRGHLSAKEYEAYEVNRRDEDEALGGFYSFKETLLAIDTETGKTKWKNEKETVFTRFLQSATPTVENDRLYILGAPRTLRCIDATNAKTLWETRLPGPFRDEFYMSSVAIADGMAAVFCGTLHGVDAATGELRWPLAGEGLKSTHTSPVVWQHKEATYVIANADGKTHCIEPRTGNVRWSIETRASQSTPLISGNQLITYGSSRKGGLRCYTMSDTEAVENWVNTTTADQGSSPALFGDHVYVMGERQLSCISLASGERVWNEMLRLAKPRYTSLAIADGKIYYPWEGLLCLRAGNDSYAPLFEGKFNTDGLLATREHHWAALKLNEREEAKARAEYAKQVEQQGPVNCTNAAIADGKIYLRMKNHLACYDLRAPSGE